MTWNIAIAALIAVSVLSIAFAFFGGRSFSERYFGPLQDFALANKALGKRNIVQLLLSTSFSLNGMLYQIWLGYKIGLWALAVQGVWALSYGWLSRYVEGVREATSLHAFLGQRYGEKTRVVAALCSIFGFAILVGWEFSVGRSTFAGILNPSTGVSASSLLLFMGGAVFVSVLYTAISGLGGDVFADTAQNLIKGGIFVIMVIFLVNNAGADVVHRLFPAPSAIIEELGVFGLITNLAFSLFWQFVDMSTWQSVIASRDRLGNDAAASALKHSGWAVFIAPGVIGTLLGVFLLQATSINSDNIMSQLIAALPTDNPFLTFLICFALIATIMSMVDGVLLAAAYSFVGDILYRRESIEMLDQDERKAPRVLAVMRAFTIIVAAVGVVGIICLTDLMNVTLFNITYVLIIAQLSLIGPVFLALRGKSAGDWMALVIAAALAVGIATFGLGTVYKNDWLTTGAGLYTIIVSFAGAVIVSAFKKQGNGA